MKTVSVFFFQKYSLTFKSIKKNPKTFKKNSEIHLLFVYEHKLLIPCCKNNSKILKQKNLKMLLCLVY